MAGGRTNKETIELTGTKVCRRSGQGEEKLSAGTKHNLRRHVKNKHNGQSNLANEIVKIEVEENS